MSVHVIESKSDVLETLSEIVKSAEDLECVMVVAIHNDGSQRLWTSSMSGYKKAFLVQFLNAWMTKWFNLESV